MSTEPTPTSDTRPTADPQPTTDDQPTAGARTTEIAARGREDPWAADDEVASAADGGAIPTARAQRQFDPTSIARLRNLMDDENAYCS